MSEVVIRLNAKALEEAASIAEILRREAGPSVENRFAQELSRTLDLLRLNTELGRKTARAKVYVLLLPAFRIISFTREWRQVNSTSYASATPTAGR